MATLSSAPGSLARGTVALLATGGFTMLVGVVFLVPFVLSAEAQQNDVFLANLFLGPLFFAVGSTLLLARLAGLGVPRGIAVTLTIGNLALFILVGVPLVLLLANVAGYRVIAPILLVYAGLLVGGSTVIVRGRGRGLVWGRAWLRALPLAIGGAGVVPLAYVLFGSRYYAFGESPATGSHLPPYLDVPLLGLSLAVGIAIFAVGWAWSSVRPFITTAAR